MSAGLVHLRVSVEGVVHTELFEADPNLSYRYSWQRKNAYNQNVYGIVTARGKSARSLSCLYVSYAVIGQLFLLYSVICHLYVLHSVIG